ncbi:MAG: MogA/MoaB family molybdenum cofactor biosynthesis protein [Spirochaetales bacterium]|nr:MogA/MoaB family molybdenum cofactor biosynthesis protein [Spirochaetales bacterium]
MKKQDARIKIITISDRAFSGEREDLSGPAIKSYLEEKGWNISSYIVIDDDKKRIMRELCYACDDERMDLVLTTGGTGFAQRDVTPEATLQIADRLCPGIAEAIRAESLKITKHAMLSRAVSVMRKQTLIINLPGSPKACREGLDVVIDALEHAIGIMRGEKLDK